MTAEKVLQIVLREMRAVSDYWRGDWRDFDGRILECQFEGIEEWANKAIANKTEKEYREESDALLKRDEESAELDLLYKEIQLPN